MREFNIFGRQVFSWGEPEQSKIKRKVTSTEYGGSEYKVGTISLQMLRKVALRSPILLKGIYKKNKDVFRNWFEIKPVDDNKKLDKTDVKILKDFDKRSLFPLKLFQAGVCADIYGTGFLEYIFYNEKGRDINPSTKPKDNYDIVDIVVLNPEFIKERKKKNKKDNILYWVYKENINSDEKYVHPERIVPVIKDKLPHSSFGTSRVDVLANVLKSKLNSDVTSGEILNWFGKGILDWTITDMDDEQEKSMIKTAKAHPDTYIHDQDYSLEVKNPTRIDPKPFYEYFYANIAACLEMPVHMLIGQQIGNVTGSEVGISDYYRDVENNQKLIFSPIVEDIYTRVLKSRNKTWRYFLDWNPIFVDELSEAKIVQTRTYSVVQLFNAGIIDAKEARGMLNEGAIVLDVDKVPKKERDIPVIPITDPNIEPQPPVKKPTVKHTLIDLLPSQKAMIDKIREFGRQEMMAQEERIKEAKKRKK